MKKESLNPQGKKSTDGELQIMRQNLKFLREARGWSLAELSEISGISKKILTGMEADEDFEVHYMIQLCRIYQVKPHKLFSRMDIH